MIDGVVYRFFLAQNPDPEFSCMADEQFILRIVILLCLK